MSVLFKLEQLPKEQVEFLIVKLLYEMQKTLLFQRKTLLFQGSILSKLLELHKTGDKASRGCFSQVSLVFSDFT